MESIPSPPEALERPNVHVVAAGTVLHRVHDRSLATDSFNPCKGGRTRFAPIHERNGHCIPSFYAGTTLESAIYETIFHDVPIDAARKTVPLFQITRRAHGTVRVLRDVALANLRAADLRKWNVPRDALVASPPSCYAQTGAWAKAIHDQFPDVEGMIWTSNQCDPHSALLLFGDRVAPTDVAVVAVRHGAVDSSFLRDARVAGARAGIAITL